MEESAMPTAVVNGVPLFYEQSGDHGEPLVLVHGSWVDHHNWHAVAPLFARSLRVLTYDRRGHSQSTRTDRPYSIREETADLAALIEHRGLAPAHIVGSSSGGSVVLRLAAERPDLFRSLAVNEPPLIDLLPNPIRQAVTARTDAIVALLEAGDTEGGVRQFVETIAFGPGMWEQIPSEVRETVTRNAPTFVDEMHDPDFFSIALRALGRFHHPALLTLGERGIPFMPPIAEQLAAALPRAQRHTFAGAGHEPEQSHPDDYVTIISAFVTRTLTGTTV